MTYRVELTDRAGRNLKHIYRIIQEVDSEQARAWFNGLEDAIFSLQDYPARCPVTPEDSNLRHLLYGRLRYVYRIIYSVDERKRVVTVLHIRHGSRQPLPTELL